MFANKASRASAFQVSQHPVGDVVVLLRIRFLIDLVRKMVQIQCGLLQLELANRLLLADVTVVVANSVAHGALSASYHFAEGALLQAICLALRIMRAGKQRRSVIRPCVSVVTEQREEARHRA